MTSSIEEIITRFRANGGEVGGPFAGKHILLLHTVGRRSGQPLVNPLLYLTEGEALVVAGVNGGAEHDPQWVADLVAAGRATVELPDRQVVVRPYVLRGGDEYDRLYVRLLEYWSDLRAYSARAPRTIPIIKLERLAPAGCRVA
ncbi:nitroreductase/quinone reductase family protein [Streptomyces sp. MK7]|uniref:nitroreductase/quinone reductase family protein n=1 Tax=Streptomyces sp. MK7 TaxID=3067635 RepID=UPI00292D63ED|nr:nitroreductase/quinone reductase family protein [Streptomyces sp. MK7]